MISLSVIQDEYKIILLERKTQEEFSVRNNLFTTPTELLKGTDRFYYLCRNMSIAERFFCHFQEE